MSTLMEDEITRWTARSAGLVLEILQAEITVAEASRAYDLPSLQRWSCEWRRASAAGRTPWEPTFGRCASNTSSRWKICRKRRARRYGSCASGENRVPGGGGREVIETIHQGLKECGYTVSVRCLRIPNYPQSNMSGWDCARYSYTGWKCNQPMYSLPTCSRL
jgi:hypothetical protein